MLLIILFHGILFKGALAEPPVNNKYLPPGSSTFQGYPAARPPNPPQLEDKPSFPDYEDPESIVIEAPTFGRTINNKINGQHGGQREGGHNTGARFNSEPLSTSVQKNPNVDSSFTHFHGTPHSLNDPSKHIYNLDQNYARTNQHTPHVHNKLTSFNNPSSYQGRSGSTSYQPINENIRSNLPSPNFKSSDSHLGGSINTFQSQSNLSPSSNDQYHQAFNKQNLNNQYLPPTRSFEQTSGYSYDRPSIPFSYDTRNNEVFSGPYSSGQNGFQKSNYASGCQSLF